MSKERLREPELENAFLYIHRADNWWCRFSLLLVRAGIQMVIAWNTSCNWTRKQRDIIPLPTELKFLKVEKIQFSIIMETGFWAKGQEKKSRGPGRQKIWVWTMALSFNALDKSFSILNLSFLICWMKIIIFISQVYCDGRMRLYS